MPPEGRNRIMIFGPKTDGTYVVEFKTDAAGTLGAGKAVVAQPCPLSGNPDIEPTSPE
jgi:hypothetical protein